VAGIVVLFFVIYLPVIRAEEIFLRERFPQFEEYAREVPVFFPRMSGFRQTQRVVLLGLYWKHREYNATARFRGCDGSVAGQAAMAVEK